MPKSLISPRSDSLLSCPFSSQLRTSFSPLNLQFLPSSSESKPQKDVCGATTPWIGSGGGSGDLWVYQTWKGNNIRFSFFYYLIPFSRGFESYYFFGLQNCSFPSFLSIYTLIQLQLLTKKTQLFYFAKHHIYYFFILQLTGKRVNVKEDELGELTPETSTADDMGDHAGIHPRQSN